MTLFIAIDPGLTNGYASYNSDTGEFVSKEYSATVLYNKLALLAWAELLPHVIIEKYTITARTAKLSQQTEALKVIGAVEYICMTGNANLYFSATGRKKFGSNAKLKALGWFKGGEGHADDAARHLLAFLSMRPEGAALLERLAA